MKSQSKNATSAVRLQIGPPDNQQERLKTYGWVVGFVDGEGSFSVSIFRNTRAQTKSGWQVFPEFVVTQGEKSLDALKQIQKLFGCGRLYKAGFKENDNHREPLYRYCVRSLGDLSQMIIPFFKENQLRTAKRYDFEKFTRIIELIEKKAHLNGGGLRKIAVIVQTMNRRKPSKFLESLETIRRA